MRFLVSLLLMFAFVSSAFGQLPPPEVVPLTPKEAAIAAYEKALGTANFVLADLNTFNTIVVATDTGWAALEPTWAADEDQPANIYSAGVWLSKDISTYKNVEIPKLNVQRLKAENLIKKAAAEIADEKYADALDSANSAYMEAVQLGTDLYKTAAQFDISVTYYYEMVVNYYDE